MGEKICNGACLFGRCPFEKCVKYEQRAKAAARIDADMNILTAGTLPRDIVCDKTGYGIAADIGTTTVAAGLYDLKSGERLSVASRINSQARMGVDVISRIKYASEVESGLSLLSQAVRSDLTLLINELCIKAGAAAEDIEHAVITGNTTMLHLLSGVDPTPMGRSPFTPNSLFGIYESGRGLSLPIKRASVYLTDCMSAFVGGDITSAVLASGMTERGGLSLLLDIGTNGEVALGNADKLYVTSTAAGPAFEGAEMACGMAGVAGAICSVEVMNGGLETTVLGGGSAKGLCGSGILDAAAFLLDAGIVDETGRMDAEEAPEALAHMMDVRGNALFAENVYMTQKDIRELQTAKAAIAAGVLCLIHSAGRKLSDITDVYLAGGFGNFMRPESALRIGLLPEEAAGVLRPIGNGALTGAAMALLSENELQKCARIASISCHVDLGGDPYFMEQYVEQMIFPEGE